MTWATFISCILLRKTKQKICIFYVKHMTDKIELKEIIYHDDFVQKKC